MYRRMAADSTATAPKTSLTHLHSSVDLETFDTQYRWSLPRIGVSGGERCEIVIRCMYVFVFCFIELDQLHRGGSSLRRCELGFCISTI